MLRAVRAGNVDFDSIDIAEFLVILSLFLTLLHYGAAAGRRERRGISWWWMSSAMLSIVASIQKSSAKSKMSMIELFGACGRSQMAVILLRDRSQSVIWRVTLIGTCLMSKLPLSQALFYMRRAAYLRQVKYFNSMDSVSRFCDANVTKLAYYASRRQNVCRLRCPNA